ncbi:MAG: hypothetical protein HC884_05075 [Chloroflexaceae bacterium]|nr:hypothetical protein [Chloroflexaceae bacterium]
MKPMAHELRKKGRQVAPPPSRQRPVVIGGVVVALFIFVLLAAVGGWLAWSSPLARRHHHSTEAPALAEATPTAMSTVATWRPTPPLTAVVVDQLGLDFPNPAFVAEANGLLEQAGYTVTYVPHDQVTVDFFRTLPSKGYDLVLLRAHSSARVSDASGKVIEDYVFLSTGEAFDEGRYRDELRSRRVGGFKPDTGSELVFVATMDFFRYSSVGRFEQSLIIMMGCDGIHSPSLAQALLDRGAAHVIGWNASVSSTHTDRATLHLLRALLTDDMPVSAALDDTRAAVGPDPYHGSELVLLSQSPY